MILVVGSIAQIGISLLSQRLPPTVILPSSAAIVHGFLFDKGVDALTRWTGPSAANPQNVFVICLTLALLSGVAWYAAARVALGPAWGLWTGICWVAYPPFAFLAQRPAALSFVILLLPTALALLAVWNKTRYRLLPALLLGLSLALLTLLGTAGTLAFTIVLPAMTLRRTGTTKKWVGVFLMTAAYCLSIAVWLTGYLGPDGRRLLQQRMSLDFWERIDTGDGSPLAAAAHAWSLSHPAELPPSSAQFFAAQWHESPLRILRWFALRMWRTLYATADGRLQRPLFVLQLCWMIPALWGFVIAVRHKPWRWFTLTAGLLFAAIWISAALTEPLARNLIPAEGLGILFALVGLADLYERIFGRRLTGLLPV